MMALNETSVFERAWTREPAVVGAADTESPGKKGANAHLTDDLAEVTMMLKTTEQRLWAIIVAYRI